MTPRKKVVEQFNELFGRQDWKAMTELLTEDIVREEVGAPALIRGKTEFERNMAPSPDVQGMTGNIARLTEEGNVVVAEGTVQLRKKDGSSMNIKFCDVFEFEGNKVKRQTSFAAVVPSPG